MDCSLKVPPYEGELLPAACYVRLGRPRVCSQ